MSGTITTSLTLPDAFLHKALLLEECKHLIGAVPSQVTALGNGSNGCFAFRLRFDNYSVKCYECLSAERASMVKEATEALQQHGVSIPSVLGVAEHLVFSEWISGAAAPTDRQLRTLKRLVDYQARIHNVMAERIAVQSPRFFHLEWLLTRMHDAGAPYVGMSTLTALSRELWLSLPNGLEPRICHPDFIVPNLVVSSGSELVIVDNEFLSHGIGWEFDVLNSSYVLSDGDEHVKRQYLDAYVSGANPGALLQYMGFWELCYIVKMIGKSFQAGDVHKGREYLAQFETSLTSYRQRNG